MRMRNTSLHATCLLALLMAAATAWSQSSTAFDRQASLLDHRIPTAFMKRLKEQRAQAMATPAQSPAKSSYQFSVVDFPGVSSSQAYDTFNGVIFGDFVDDQNLGAPTGFTMKGNVAQQFSIQGFSGIPSIYAVSTSGEMVGFFIEPQIGVGRSFEIVNGEATIFDPPQSTLDAALGVNASGTIVGYYIDTNSVAHGYLYSGGQFTTIDPPGATLSYASFRIRTGTDLNKDKRHPRRMLIATVLRAHSYGFQFGC